MARTGWLSVKIMWLSGISGHGAGSMASQWGSTIKSPWMRTVTRWYLSWYDLIWCCKDVKLQQPSNSYVPGQLKADNSIYYCHRGENDAPSLFACWRSYVLATSMVIWRVAIIANITPRVRLEPTLLSFRNYNALTIRLFRLSDLPRPTCVCGISPGEVITAHYTHCP